MKLSKLQIVLPALLVVIACAYGQDVHYNYDRGADFQSYRTYQWVDLHRGQGRPSTADFPRRFAKFAGRATTCER